MLCCVIVGVVDLLGGCCVVFDVVNVDCLLFGGDCVDIGLVVDGGYY